LGFGVLSTGPAQAVVNSDILTVSSSTATATIGQTSDSASASTVTLSFLATNPTDSMSLVASLVSSPATNTSLPKLNLVETGNAFVWATGNTVDLDDGSGSMLTAGTVTQLQGVGTDRLSSTNISYRGENWGGSVATSDKTVYVASQDRTLSSAKVISATFKVYIDAPTVAGTYVVRVTPAITGNGAAGGVAGNTTMQATYKDITITVSAAACVRGCSAATSEASWSSMYYGSSTRGVTLADLTSAQNPGDSVINFTMAMTGGTANVRLQIFLSISRMPQRISFTRVAQHRLHLFRPRIQVELSL